MPGCLRAGGFWLEKSKVGVGFRGLGFRLEGALLQ